MSINVKLSDILQQLAKTPETVEVDGRTVKECLDDLFKKYPASKKWLMDKNGKLRVLATINTESEYLEDLNRPISAGDTLHLILIFAGG